MFNTIIIVLLFNSLVLAQQQEISSHEIRLELGENHLLKKSFSKIWIENKKLLAVRNKGPQYYLKTSKPGVTHIRLDNILYKVIISPIGSKKTYSDWQALAGKFTGLTIDYCEYMVCLKGQLTQINDYDRIINYIEEYQSKIHIALKVDADLTEELQKKIGTHLRTKGITPLKIQFSTPWKIFYSKKKYVTEKEDELMVLGLSVEYLEHTTDIADNIKVAVKVVEITKNFEHKLGVRWPDSYQAQIIGNSTAKWADSFDIAISAAEKSGEAKVLASPNLICRSGKEAEFFAGGEFPVKIIHLRSTEVIWKRYGIGLKIKPQIDPFGQMSLHIESEVSTLDRSIRVEDIPAIHSNRVSSYFDLISSRTIALSGLIKSEVSESSEGVPFLKNIPILGALFSSKNFQENKSELVIFVTPELMN
ncbi:MAG: hypothetical protein AABY53_02755 [Bdellovibrionota bacterium]